MKFTTIIITYFAQNQERSDFLRKSLLSLIETTRDTPVELIVIDNGNNIKDSFYLLDLAHEGVINTYVRNSTNMHFGYARMQGLNMANGDYICIADSDIDYKKGWLEACIAVLQTHENRKIYATPIYNVAHWLPKYWHKDRLLVDGEEYGLNSRAGSNCFVVRRQDFEEIGGFLAHRVAGTKWTERACKLGYLAAVTPRVMADDMGFRKGYNYKDAIPIREVLSNGKEVYFNEDEFRRNNRGLYHLQQRRFNPRNYRSVEEDVQSEG